MCALRDAGQALLPVLFLRTDSHVVVCPGLGAVAAGGWKRDDEGAGGGGKGKQCFEQLGIVRTSSHLHVHTVEAGGLTAASTPVTSRPEVGEEGEGGGAVVSNPFGLEDSALRDLMEAEDGMAGGGGEEWEGSGAWEGGEGCRSPWEYVRCIEHYYSWHREQPLALGDQRVFVAVRWR